MAATKTATIKLGAYTRQVTKASDDKQTVIDQCRTIASERNLVIVVKRDWKDRWQGFAKRHNARGAGQPKDYEFMPEGRRARRLDEKVKGGRVYVADTSAGTGPVEAEEVLTMTKGETMTIETLKDRCLEQRWRSVRVGKDAIEETIENLRQLQYDHNGDRTADWDGFLDCHDTLSRLQAVLREHEKVMSSIIDDAAAAIGAEIDRESPQAAETFGRAAHGKPPRRREIAEKLDELIGRNTIHTADL